MLKNKLAVLTVLVTFVIALGGCATGRKQRDLEIQGLRNQVSALQTQLQSKDDEINALKEQKTRAGKTLKTGAHQAIPETKLHPTVQQIQMSLKNAGYYSGVVDGKTGKQTRDAIKAFQKANNLRANGRVGKQTWNLLKEYLEKKVK